MKKYITIFKIYQTLFFDAQKRVKENKMLLPTGGRKHWVGGTDMMEEGKWAWFPGNEPVTYTDWLPTEPDNKLHSSLEKEHCMTLSPSSHIFYQWSDEICSKLLNFICERIAIRSGV